MKSRLRSGMTRVELIVAITILLALILFVATPQVGSPVKFTNTATVSNMRQLHMAIQQMTLDNEVAGKPLRWTCEGSQPVSREKLIRALLNGPYLQEDDLKKLLSVRDKYGAVTRTVILFSP